MIVSFILNSAGELTPHKYYIIKNRKSKALTLLLPAAFLTCFASHDKKAV